MSADAVRKAIDEGNRRFGEAAGRKDFAGMAALYTENAKLLPPDAPVIDGRSAIEEFWRAAASALGLIAVALKTTDLQLAGDTAYEVGEAHLKLASGEAKVKYLVVWLKDGTGQWRLHRDIWNAGPPN